MPHRFDDGHLFDTGLFFDDTAVVVVDPGLPGAATGIPTRIVARLVVLASVDGPVLVTFEDTDQRGESGSVTFERTRTVARRGSATIIDPAGDLTPQQPGDLFWPPAIVRLERGVLVGGQPEYQALTTLVVKPRTSMSGRIELSGEGILSQLAQPFGEPEVIPAETPAEDALRTLWAPVLDPQGDGASWPLDGGGRVMPLRVFLADEDRLDAVVRWFAASGLQVTEDRLGRPLMRRALDISDTSTVAVVRGFEPGADATILSLERTVDRQAFNRVIVESNAPGGPDIRVVVTVDDPASPIHPDRIGLRSAPVFRSAQVPDLGAAGVVARRLLAEYALGTETLSGSAVPDTTLDAGDIVTIDEPVSGASGQWRIDSLTLPWLTGSMSFTASRVLPLLLTGDGT